MIQGAACNSYKLTSLSRIRALCKHLYAPSPPPPPRRTSAEITLQHHHQLIQPFIYLPSPFFFLLSLHHKRHRGGRRSTDNVLPFGKSIKNRRICAYYGVATLFVRLIFWPIAERIDPKRKRRKDSAILTNSVLLSFSWGDREL